MRKSFQSIIDTLQWGVSGVFPGAVLRVSVNGEVVIHEAVGKLSHDLDASDATVHTRYDIASLTKPILVGTIAMLAYDNRVIDLDESVFIPDDTEEDGPLNSPTVRNLLAHRSGLPAWLPLGQRLWEQHPDIPPGGPEAVRLFKAWIRGELANLPPSETIAPPVYSDIGYILLGWWFEQKFGMPLDRLVDTYVLRPWGLHSTQFVSTKDWGSWDSPLAGSVAPTEYCPLRNRIVIGQVHDENAFALGGVCGHAGLFATADDVGKWADQLLNSYAGFGPVTEHTMKLFWEPHGVVPNRGQPSATLSSTPVGGVGTWRLCWDTPSSTGSSGGNTVPTDAVCHLGFTGCSVWIAPSLRTSVVLLSNRVHPSRKNEAIKSFRPTLHDLVWDTIRQNGM